MKKLFLSFLTLLCAVCVGAQTVNSLETDADGYYLIGSVADWQAFAEMVNSGTNASANARMTADIDLNDDQTVVGASESTAYQGNFDGNGHTLTIAYNTSTWGSFNLKNGYLGVAPFNYVSGATIRNLHTTGTIYTTKIGATGLVGWALGNENTIAACRSSVTITGNGDADTFAGFVFRQDGAVLNISDCLFDGIIRPSWNGSHAGFVGHAVAGTTNVTNSLTTATYDYSGGTDFASFVRNVSHESNTTLNITNCYYLNHHQTSSYNAVQGTQVTVNQLADGTITTALQADRSESVWVQDGDVPMLAQFATKGTNYETTPGEAIDLGLPSGTRWASCNVGASKPEDFGNFYAWGETETKETFTWENYKYGSSNNNLVDIGTDISGTEYDVAHVKWGGDWRMPTRADVEELIANCTSEWTTLNGVVGRMFTGPNGNTLFFPATGWMDDATYYGLKTRGTVWTSTARPDYRYWQYGLHCTANEVEIKNDFYIRGGNVVRPVMSASPSDIVDSALRDTVPSNYGNWMNLTDGYTEDKGYNHQKMQVEIDDNSIHLCWAELTQTADKTWRVWYRRSTDLGKTWDKARVVFEVNTDWFLSLNSNTVNKLMSVSGKNVHFAITCENRSISADSYGYPMCVRYLHSLDGGATFEKEDTIHNTSWGWVGIRGTVIDSDGDMVTIAAPSNRDNNINYLTSQDNGRTWKFITQKIEPSGETPWLCDMQVNQGRWASMVLGSDWYSGLKYGDIHINVFDGTEIKSKSISPLFTNGKSYAYPDIMNGGNGNSYNYHPQMAIEGNTIHVAYRGNPGNTEDSQDYGHTLYQRSDDFGQTWTEAVTLPESTGGHGTIAARGNNVYVVTTRNGLHTVYYSHDKGATWETVTQTLFPDNRYNPMRSYSLTVDPNDAKGEHVWFTGNRFFYVETLDGFRTIAKNFCLGTESWTGTYYSNNHALNVYADKNGTSHWFMQMLKPVVKENPNGGGYVDESGSRDIVYRRAEAEPAPIAEDMALNLTDTLAPQHRVVVPMSPSLQQTKAITVECWLQPDKANAKFQIAACTDDANQEGSQYQGGWYILQNNTYGGEHFYWEGGICTDSEEHTVGARVYDWDNPDALVARTGAWHHIALTYDDNVVEKNVCLYVDGKLAASNTIHGNLVLGKNPITLGRANGYYGSQGLLDNFAIWNRALSSEEIAVHALNPNDTDGKDEDCRLLLTFDGTLKDQSQYGNDGVALMDIELTAHEDIVPVGITQVTTDNRPTSSAIYSLDGRRMTDDRQQLRKGIYISRGRKFVIR